MQYRPIILCLTLLAVSPATGRAWWESGHHLVAVMAFERLSPTEQQTLLRLIRRHPRFAEDFQTPEGLTDQAARDRWLVGRAAYWPDVARRTPEWNRPTWHYQLAATMTLGAAVDTPTPPGPPPADADLQTSDLYIHQAVIVNRKILSDPARSDADRALAICWLGHLVGDAHQPCHAGSLYSQRIFPDGDRGANSIPTKQLRNLHAVWDSLLGQRLELRGIRQRAILLARDQRLADDAGAVLRREDSLDPLTWLAESREISTRYVYTPAVLESVEAAERGLTEKPATIALTDDYLRRGTGQAELQAVRAAYRLAEIWRQDLQRGSVGAPGLPR